MASIALVNVYKKHEGITVATLLYQQALTNSGFETSYYQCVEERNEEYHNDSIKIEGINLRNKYLSKSTNRAIVFPFRLRNLREDLILLSDPWLLNVTSFRKNVVVIVHDLRLVTQYSENMAQTLMFKMLLLKLKSAKKIISISNTTKSELITFGINSNSIEVIHHCTDLNVNSEKHKLNSLSKIKSGRPLNVVYIANDIPYKNISTFIHISEQLSRGDNHDKFVFTLLSKLGNNNLKLLRRNELNNLSVIGHLDRLEDFYEKADILLFTSNYEGFGRPLIEAMKSGIPIVGRNIPIVREITGDASILVDSDRIDEWIGALTLLYDFTEYENMANKSIKRSAEFSVEKFSLRVADVFRSILQRMDTHDG